MTDNWELDHIAIIVKDIDKAIAYFQSFGAVVTRPAMETGWDENHIKEVKYYGKTLTEPIKIKWGMVKLGPLNIEFHQPVSGDSPWMEYLKKHGEGIDHICYTVDDVAAEKEKMVKRGIPIIVSVEDPDGTLADVYYDTREIGNVAISTFKKGGI